MSNFYKTSKELMKNYMRIKTHCDGLSNEELIEIIKNSSSEYEVEEAKSQLISNNISLCYKFAEAVAKKTGISRDAGEDLIQEGISAMFNSIESYDPGKAKFSTYIKRKIENAVETYIRTKGPLAVSEKTSREICKAKAIENRLESEGIYERETLEKMIASEMGKGVKVVRKYIYIGNSGILLPYSYEEVMGEVFEPAANKGCKAA